MSVPTGWVRVTPAHVQAQGSLRQHVGHWVRLERRADGSLRVSAHGQCDACTRASA